MEEPMIEKTIQPQAQPPKPSKSSTMYILGLLLIAVLLIIGFVWWQKANQGEETGQPNNQTATDTNESTNSGEKVSTPSAQIDESIAEDLDSTVTGINNALSDLDSITADIDAIDMTQDNAPEL
ncbi:MAG: hypothetical protein WC497_06280 [Patescibacteria group bacterium]